MNAKTIKNVTEVALVVAALATGIKTLGLVAVAFWLYTAATR